jgi:gamma-glutamylcyclotransferase (GGCT)/AIG2-like uncharacterized protein YtfP
MYYFAYGSSMNFHQMRRICGWHFTVDGRATLADFEFGLDKRGYSAVHQKIGSKVWGVLYKVDQYSIDAMDEFEGYPNVFDRLEVPVEDENGNKCKAWVYLQKPDQFGGTKANENHLKMLIAGAMAGHLPEEWIKFLESFQDIKSV